MRFLLAALLLLAPFVTVEGRPVDVPSNQELFDKADLVVIARPVSTKDTSEQRALPGMERVPALGVETKFEVSAVLKGRKSIKTFVLHHYRWHPKDAEAILLDGPSFLHFDPKDADTGDYLLFLVREAGGRYAPATGQVDPAVTSVFELWGAVHWGAPH